MKRWSALAFLLAIAGALALRWPQLAVRPLHGDEAVNATKLAELWETGHYQYDPNEYHGPTLYYFSLPFLWLSPVENSAGFSETTLRTVTVAFGVGLILLLLLLSDGLGAAAVAWAAGLLAVSPAMVFYSRYFIHEMPLVFCSLLALAAGWRYAQSRRTGWAGLAGAGLGLMWATKETFVLSLAAGGIAFATEHFWGPRRVVEEKKVPKSHVAIALLMAFAVSQLLFSSFLANARGPVDSLKTFLPWLNRAGGASPHLHPWYFYFERLLWFHPAKSPVWSEAAILILALVGSVAAFSTNRRLGFRPRLARLLVFYTLTLAAIYSFISYKTPWCLLNFWLGMILLAGIGAATLVRLCRSRFNRLITGTALAVGVAQLAWQARLASIEFAASPRNPYTYSQTTEGCRELVQRVEGMAHLAASGSATVVKVIAPESYWPLPWYLRRFKSVGWWEQLPEDPYAPIVIVSAELGAALDEKSNRAWLMTGIYELRPGVFLELYVERALWGKYVAALPRSLP